MYLKVRVGWGGVGWDGSRWGSLGGGGGLKYWEEGNLLHLFHRTAIHEV